MNKSIQLLFLLACPVLWAQSALYNTGNLRVHDGGSLGFHSDLINEGIFDENEGLVGFYGGGATIVSGAIAPTFKDVEFGNLVGVFLRTSINVENNVNFVSGNVITPRNLQDAYLNFMDDAFYVGETDATKVFGYAAITNQQFFTFPVGDGDQLRPLILNSGATNPFAQCSYFFEDASSPLSIDTAFDRQSKSRDIEEVLDTEFWILRSEVTSNISISWNERSNLSRFTDNINDIAVVGWNLAVNQWVLLGGVSRAGTLTEGFITSENFDPTRYGALTFGVLGEAEELLELDNYFISPNGDGINDALVIEGMEKSPNNLINIFNKQGQKIFEMTNYSNEFVGFSNQDNFVLNRDIGVPEGIYYYTVVLYDLNQEFQGFFYLDR